jgi:hypothetical protein
MLQAFISWQAAAQHTIQLRVKAVVVGRQWLNRSLAAAFRAWRCSAAYQVQLRSKAAMLVAARTSGRLRMAFASWAAYVQLKQGAARKVSHKALGTVAGAGGSSSPWHRVGLNQSVI